MRYFDASALAKRYLDEAQSAAVLERLEQPAATSRLSAVEVASAIVRRSRENKFSADDRVRALRALERDLDEMLIVELTPDVAHLAKSLLERHSLRSSDAIHLASCLTLSADLEADIPFVVFDTRLRAAAAAEDVLAEP